MNEKTKHRALAVVLSCLIVLAIGLAVAILLVKGRNETIGCEGNSGEGCVKEEENDSLDDVLSEEDQVMIDAAQEEMDQWDEKYQSFENDMMHIRNEAKEYLETNPVDFDAIHRIYSEYEEKYKGSGDLSFVGRLMFDERNLFLESEKKEEALRGLTLNDYSVFPEWEQHDYYNAILDLARELGDEEIIVKYQPLFDTTQAAWDENMNKIENAISE